MTSVYCSSEITVAVVSTYSIFSVSPKEDYIYSSLGKCMLSINMFVNALLEVIMHC